MSECSTIDRNARGYTGGAIPVKRPTSASHSSAWSTTSGHAQPAALSRRMPPCTLTPPSKTGVARPSPSAVVFSLSSSVRASRSVQSRPPLIHCDQRRSPTSKRGGGSRGRLGRMDRRGIPFRRAARRRDVIDADEDELVPRLVPKGPPELLHVRTCVGCSVRDRHPLGPHDLLQPTIEMAAMNARFARNRRAARRVERREYPGLHSLYERTWRQGKSLPEAEYGKMGVRGLRRSLVSGDPRGKPRGGGRQGVLIPSFRPPVGRKLSPRWRAKGRLP